MIDVEKLARESGFAIQPDETEALEMLTYFARLVMEECAKIAAGTVCDLHIPTGLAIYGTRVAKEIRARMP